MSKISRRKLFSKAGKTAGMTLLGIPLLSCEEKLEKKKIVVTGGHPDDPETGCGGLIARLTDAGHEVTIGYLTKGEAGIPGTSHDDAATIRMKEAKNACSILNATPKFLGQIDGNTTINNKAYEKMYEFLNTEKPDLLLTHWPIDTHRDHRACSAITYAAWLWLENKPDLYFYEVLSGGQTQNFPPTDFVDITPYKDIKREACFAHASQEIEKYYDGDHAKMEQFRGLEANTQYAEAYIRHFHSSSRML